MEKKKPKIKKQMISAWEIIESWSREDERLREKYEKLLKERK